MKSLIVFSMLLFVNFAHAEFLNCRSHDSYPIDLSATVGSDRKLWALEVNSDEDMARKASVVIGREYSKGKYKNMTLFSLDAKDADVGVGWEDSRMSVLLPYDFAKKRSFKGVLVLEVGGSGRNKDLVCTNK